MKVNDKLIEDLSRLAKLKFNNETTKKMKNDLEKIIGFIDKLSEVDTEDVEPLVYLNDETNILRSDNISDELSQEEALKNAPQKDSDYFKVPINLKK